MLATKVQKQRVGRATNVKLGDIFKCQNACQKLEE